jgi:carboxylate-amine ligase
MPPELKNAREFDELVRGLEMIDAIEDATFLYWYVRPSSRYPTLEFRVCDVCLTPEETTVLAALVRSLTWSCAREASVARPMSTPRPELLEAAVWRAGRYGLGANLISPLTLTPRPAHEVVRELMAFVRDGLEAHDEREEVEAMMEEILGRGNGAHRQRKVWKATDGDGSAVVDYVLDKTASTDT